MENEEKKVTKKPAAKKTTSAKKTAAKKTATKKPTTKKTTVKKVEAPKEEIKAAEVKEEVKVEKSTSPEIKTESQKASKNNTFVIFLIAVIGLAAAIGVVLAFSLGKKDDVKEKDATIEKVGKEKVKITKNETSTIKYDKFDNGLVSFDYPKGWTVEVAPAADYIHYNFKVYNPDDPDYLFFFGLKFEGYMKSNKARNWQKRVYPDSMFAKLPAISSQTTEAFFKVWNEAADYSNKEENKSKYFNHLNDFVVIENLGKNDIGGDILRATYTNDAGKLNQGLFTATVKSPGSYYMAGMDMAPLLIYNIIYMSAPDEDFVNWQPILDKCLTSIEFSQKFIDNFNSQEALILKTIQANQKIYDQISDMIMDSWEKRSNSYDIISQKRSDAALGYERVYDTDTGEIYKADLGFTDTDWNGKYEPVTDDMYNLPTSGYIEKVN